MAISSIYERTEVYIYSTTFELESKLIKSARYNFLKSDKWIIVK